MSVASDDPYDVIDSNVTFVNALLEDAMLHHDEISRDALRSYYVSNYVGEVNNGGFAQFVWNSRWDDDVVTLVREGLQAMGASRQLALFDEGARLVAGLGAERLAAFFGELDPDNPETEELDTVSDTFFELSEEEDLIALNAAWLRGLPDLTVLSIEEAQAEIERIAAAVPDRADRVARTLANEPEYLRIIRALCARAGHALDRVTSVDPTTLRSHFITDHGPHYLVLEDGKALMFAADVPEPVTELSAAVMEQLTAPTG